MKRIVPILVFALSSASLSAQINPEQKDWFIFNYTYDQLINGPGSLSNEVIPYGFSLTLMQDKPFGHGRFGMAYGLGYTWNRYYNNLSVVTDPATGDEAFGFLNMDSINRNVLRTDFIDGLLEFRYRTKPNAKGRYFRLYVGGKIGVRVYSSARLVTDNVNLQYNALGALNRIRYGVYTRIGFGAVNLYGYYGLSEVFTEGSIVDGNSTSDASDIRSLSLGLSLTF
jgi:hypothetical protein